MKITFSNKPASEAPKAFTRIALTEEPKGTMRTVREHGVETIELGIGARNEMTMRKFRIACRALVRAAKEAKAKKIALQCNYTTMVFPNIPKDTVPPSLLYQTAAENFVLGDFEWNEFKTKPKEGWNTIEEILLCGLAPKGADSAVKKGIAIGEAVNACRSLANMPAGDMTPKSLAKAAKQAVSGLPVKVTTLGRKELEKLGMGALLGVAKGSSEEPTFTILEYKGAPRKASTRGTLVDGGPIILAGKGVTFDSGGLNLKPSNFIYEMHMDMAGAASVIHAVALAARLKTKTHIIGLIPAVENMVSGSSYRPGDVLKSLSGKTIEVLNTDAEGRLILADALTYAKRFKPAVVLDVATLTGAAMVALGLYATGLLTRDDELSEKLLALGETSGDYLWRLPMWDEYEDAVKGTFADITNSSVGPTARYGGATEGGMFLWQFAKELDCPWAHLDIAPRMTSAPGDELAKGAAGAPVRLLFQFIEEWESKK